MRDAIQVDSREDLLKKIKTCPGKAPRFVPPIAKLILGLLILLDIPLLFKMSSLAYPINSDHVQNVLEVTSILHGNILLHGWTLTPEDFYLSDNPFFLLTRLIFGRSLISIYTATFLIYIFVLVNAAGITLLVNTTSLGRWVGLLAILFYLGTPQIDGAAPWVFVGAQHIAVLGFCLLSWLLLEAALRADRWQSMVKLAVLFGFSAFVALLSDPLATAVFLLPTVFTLSVEFLAPTRGGAARRRMVAILILLLLAAFDAAHIALFVIRTFNGFAIRSAGPLTGFVTADGLGANAEGIFFGLISLSGGYVFGGAMSGIQAMGSILRLFGLGLMLASVFISLRRWLRSADGWDLRFVLALAISADIMGSLVSQTFHVTMGSHELTGGPAIRYLTPALLFGGVLTALEIPSLINNVAGRNQRSILAVVMAGGFAVVAGLFGYQTMVSWQTQPAIATAPGRIVGQWLLSQGLTHGVGDYWDSMLVTALSGQKVAVRAVVDDNGKAVPFIWITNSDWYKTKLPPQFVLYADNDPNGITPKVIAATYGQPVAVKHVAGYNIALLPIP